MSLGGGSYVALAAGETEPVSDAVPHLLGGLRRGWGTLWLEAGHRYRGGYVSYPQARHALAHP
ncbi:MAG TPA: hypothetical protein VHF46_00510 [Rubrobacteraceae bacterium]|nr:hypothetical protein [Rubrobacteraceae bacterium]